MANLVVVLDDDAPRRLRYVKSVSSKVAPVPQLTVSTCEGEGWTALWAAAPSAPVSWEADATGGAVVWGEAIDEAGHRQTAAQVRAAWQADTTATWDGYFAAAAVDADGRLTFGADVLGIFPVYYWQGPGVVLVGTSPELFTAHPGFRRQLDVAGLVGVLLTNGVTDGATLWTDVRRLAPGRQLQAWSGQAREVETYQVPQGEPLTSLPLAGHAALLGDAVAAAIQRHAPAGPQYGMLLSGGLDSRMVAGFLTRSNIRPHALTLGLPSDLDVRCAIGVAQALNLTHVTAEPDPTVYSECASLQAEWEHLNNGFNTIRDWWTLRRVGQIGSRVVTGLLADAIVGGTAVAWGYSQPPPKMSYEAFAEQMPRLGVPGDVLRELLVPEYEGLVQSTQDYLRREFQDFGDSDSYRAWRYDLAHGQRFHVGGTPWRLSFGSWPALPMLDRSVLAVASSIPAASLANRFAQLALVQARLRELMHVPLDRSDLMAREAQYLSPVLRPLLAQHARSRARQVLRALRIPRFRSDSRYWYRVNDFDGTAWRLVRHAAEPFRSRLLHVFNADVLDAVLPGPQANAQPGFQRVPESGRKLLTGLMQWAGAHL